MNVVKTCMMALALCAGATVAMADGLSPTLYSNAGWHATYVAGNLVDGDEATFGYAPAGTPTVVLDLGSVVDVRNIALTGRAGTNTDDMTGITIEVFDNDDPATGSLVAAGAWDGVGSFNMNRGHIIPLTSVVIKRYVKVTFAAGTTNGVQLAELTVNATIMMTDADKIDTWYHIGRMTRNASTWGRTVNDPCQVGWCILDMGDHANPVWGLTLTSAPSYADMLPGSGSIMASDDPTSFTQTVATFAGVSSPAGAQVTYTFGTSTMARYLKLIWTSIPGAGDVQFRCADMDPEDGSYVPDSGWSTTYPASNLLDGDQSTFAHSPTGNATLILDLGTVQDVRNIALTGRTTDTDDMTGITIEVFDNDDPMTGSLVTVGTWDGTGDFNRNRGQIIPFTSAVTRRYLKVSFAAGTTNGVQLAELTVNENVIIYDADKVDTWYPIGNMTRDPATWGRLVNDPCQVGWCILDTGNPTAAIESLTMLAKAADMLPGSGTIMSSDDPTSFDPNTDTVMVFSGVHCSAGQTVPFNFSTPATGRFLKVTWDSIPAAGASQFRCSDMDVADHQVSPPVSCDIQFPAVNSLPSKVTALPISIICPIRCISFLSRTVTARSLSSWTCRPSVMSGKSPPPTVWMSAVPCLSATAVSGWLRMKVIPRLSMPWPPAIPPKSMTAISCPIRSWPVWSVPPM